MARTRVPNPLAFRRTPVTFIGTVSYIALFASLIWTHTTVPPAPSDVAPAPGINLTQAWLDLEFLSDGYHPWGSHRNDVVREYLLQRIHEILDENKADYQTVFARSNGSFTGDSNAPAAVTVFANDTSNFTALDDWTTRPWTLYGESTNLLVYIRGTDDPADDTWWRSLQPRQTYTGRSGVLVNAHYDSVASGFGATDDGVGVATVLQLLAHFSRKHQQPRRGIVALLNNGEEDGLFGARNYLRHPLARLPHTFLNLEGAGSGGRAMLFRSSDAEVTVAYARSPRPFGSVVSGDGFKRGFVKSGTDYSVFTEKLGLRGLDVAFFEPRARYHTNQDAASETSVDSLWHMLSASLATMRALTDYSGGAFEGSPDERGKIDSGAGSDGVWFDLFGRAFAVMQLNSLFAVSVTLLVAGPVLLLLLELVIRRSGKWYLFAGKRYLRSPDDDDSVHLHGRRGLFRFPVAVAVSTAAVVALAFLVTKLNPLILYSSEYAVWAMMISAWFALAWFLSAGAANVRPTALQRMYALIWLYVISWILLVFATVGENNLHLASGYFVVILNASVFVALLISHLEMFSLPKITKYVEHVSHPRGDDRSLRSAGRSSSRVITESTDRERASNDERQPTERTSLLQGDQSRRSSQTFTAFRRKRPDRDEVPADTDDPLLNKPYLEEQAWSSCLLRWTWFIQFLALVPINVIIIGQIALLMTASLHQTPADGNSVLSIYLLMSILTVLLLLPIMPFIHRFTYRVPSFLFLVFVGCLIYTLIAFPFSRDARMKYFFVQTMDLDTGANNVSLTGINGYLHQIIDQMPSAAGERLQCSRSKDSLREGLRTCSWPGLQPNVVPNDCSASTSKNSSKLTYSDWLNYNITHADRTASITLQGLNSRVCYLQFDHPVSEVHIQDGELDPRLQSVPDAGASMVRLFSRSWDKTFNVTVSWKDAAAKGQRGRAICAWSDVNQNGIIPAYDEVLRFQPVWAAVTKLTTGLVEGWKDFKV